MQGEELQRRRLSQDLHAVIWHAFLPSNSCSPHHQPLHQAPALSDDGVDHGNNNDRGNNNHDHGNSNNYQTSVNAMRSGDHAVSVVEGMFR